MSNFHNRMINVPVRDVDVSAQHGMNPVYAYKVGHRDARHAAAEIAIEADQIIEAQSRALEAARETLTRIGYGVYLKGEHRDIAAEALAQIEAVKEGQQ